MEGKIIDFAMAKRQAMDKEANRVGNQLRELVMMFYHLGGMEALEDMARSSLETMEKAGENRAAATWVLLADIRGWLGDEVADKLTVALQDVIGTGHTPRREKYSNEEVDQAEAVYRATMRGSIRVEHCPASEKLFVINQLAVYAGSTDPDVFAVQKQQSDSQEYGKIIIRDGAVLGTAKNAIAFLMRYADEIRIRSAFSDTGIPAVLYEYRTAGTDQKDE